MLALLAAAPAPALAQESAAPAPAPAQESAAPAVAAPAATATAAEAPAPATTRAAPAPADKTTDKPADTPDAGKSATKAPEGDKPASAAAGDIPPMPVMHEGRQMEDMGTVVIRTIDKLSARAHTFDIPVDKTVKFGNSLFIKARACRKASPLDQPESAAFLQIWERKPAEQNSRWVFSGWMFASNPSLSYMDHPVYDVWVIECKNAVTSAKASEQFSSEKTPAHTPAKDAAAAVAAVSGKPAKDAGDKDEASDDDADDEDAEATPDKPAADKPAVDKPAVDKPVPAADKPEAGKAAKPLTPAEARDAAERALTEKSFEDDAASKPAAPEGEVAPAGKTAPVPAIDKLPGSFEDGEDSKDTPAD